MKKALIFSLLCLITLTHAGCSHDKDREDRIMKRRRGGATSYYLEKPSISSGIGAVILTFSPVTGWEKETV